MLRFSTKRSPAELFRALYSHLEVLCRLPDTDRRVGKAVEGATKHLQSLGAVLGGPGEPHPVLIRDVGRAAQQSEFFVLLVGAMWMLGSDGKKSARQLFCILLEWEVQDTNPIVDHLDNNPEPLWKLFEGYEDRSTALPCGAILRDCARHAALARRILYSDRFYSLFTYVDTNLFDISTDAFCTFKDLLTRHKVISAEYLDRNYTAFFERFHELIISDNYVTRRQSLELLAKIILERHNYSIMMRYISDKENLRRVMRMFQQSCRATKYESFHIFKVFVANPQKSKDITDILIRNREEIIRFISGFQNDRSDDEQFYDEKQYIIKQMKEL